MLNILHCKGLWGVGDNSKAENFNYHVITKSHYAVKKNKNTKPSYTINFLATRSFILFIVY